MQGAPAPLAAGNLASDTNKELLNTPEALPVEAVMATKEEFNHYQPLGNSDPAHTAIAPGGLSAKTPAMTPLMLDGTTRKLVVWDGTTDGAAVGILAVAADQTSTDTDVLQVRLVPL